MSPNVPPAHGPKADPASITPAEHRVLSALCGGGSNRAIAAGLVISTRTVEGHISSLLLKTGCHSRTQLVLWALGHRQLPVGSVSTPA
jgi:DNA-binding NarL/FixJ family response regulator